MTFPSPQAAFAYYSIGRTETVVEGEETTLVLSVEGANTKRATIFPETKEGWKLPSQILSPGAWPKVREPKLIYVYSLRNSSDYYIRVMNFPPDGKPMNVSDSNGSLFRRIKEASFEEYIAYIGNLNERAQKDYYLVVNGEKIAVFD